MKYCLGIFFFLTSLCGHAALNKWVDADGKVHYSDTPPTGVATQKLKSSAPPDSAGQVNEVAAPKTTAEREAEWKKSQQAKEEAEKKSAKEKEVAAVKKQNCTNARSNLKALENSPLLVTYDEKGERTFLDESARKREIDNASKAVSTHCN